MSVTLGESLTIMGILVLAFIFLVMAATAAAE